MEETFKLIAGYTALGLEGVAVLVIAWGGLRAFLEILFLGWNWDKRVEKKKEIWLRFGMWLLLGLEFELAADIVRTAIAPSWIDVGQLGAIAVIRTFLNYFLEKDLEKYGAAERRGEVS